MTKHEAPKVASPTKLDFHNEQFVSGTSDVHKLILVVMDGPTPVYEFRGNWTGRDLKDVQRLFRREYLKHQRRVRRETPPMKEE